MFVTLPFPGINTLKLSNTEGVGFAIPIDTAWQVIEALRLRGRVDRPHLGMRMVTADTQRSNGTNGGVMVSRDLLFVKVWAVFLCRGY